MKQQFLDSVIEIRDYIAQESRQNADKFVILQRGGNKDAVALLAQLGDAECKLGDGQFRYQDEYERVFNKITKAVQGSLS